VESFTSSYLDEVRTSQETHKWTTTSFYGDSLISLYVDEVRTSQEIHKWTTTACYGDGFTCLYLDNIRTSQETRVSPAAVTGTAVLSHCLVRRALHTSRQPEDFLLSVLSLLCRSQQRLCSVLCECMRILGLPALVRDTAAGG
jgi:hypothetical protein